MVVRVGAGRSPERAFHITQLGDGVAQNLVGLCLGPIARTRAEARVQVERRTQMSQGGRDMFHRSNAMPLIVVVSPYLPDICPAAFLANKKNRGRTDIHTKKGGRTYVSEG